MVGGMIRVDYAGEYGANRIYAGQLAVLQNTGTGPTIRYWTNNKCIGGQQRRSC